MIKTEVNMHFYKRSRTHHFGLICLIVLLFTFKLNTLEAQTLGTPEGLGPTGHVNTSNPTFSWTAVAGADRYRLAVHFAEGAGLFELTEDSTSIVSAVPLQYGHCYHWWVRAENNTLIGPWSALNTVCYADLLGNPQPISPQAYIDSGPLTFDWAVDPAAERYRLTVHRSEGGLVFEITTTDAHYVHNSGLAFGHCYSWTVRSERAGEAGLWAKSYGVCNKPEPPEFQDEFYDNPLQSMKPKELDDVRRLHGVNFAEFARNFYPKLGLPVERKNFRGIWRYFDWQGRDGLTVYDGDLDKVTYQGHGATDFWVDPLDYDCTAPTSGCTPNFLINPFPEGAMVWVESINNTVDEGNTPIGGPGNTLKLVCYFRWELDPNGNPIRPDDSTVPSWQKVKLEFYHLRKDSFLVDEDDRVVPGQRLAQVGLTGDTVIQGLHVHGIFGSRLDPFEGGNNTRLNESLFWHQPTVERWENFYELFVDRGNLRIDGDYQVSKINGQSNRYKFTSIMPINRLLITQTSQGVEIDDFDLLSYLDSAGVPVTRREYRNVRLCKKSDVCTDQTNIYEVSFDWDFWSLMPGQWTFVAENNFGRKSNKVFVDYTQ